MADYIQGQQVTLFKSYTTPSGQAYNVGVSGNTVNVFYFVTGTKTFDVVSGTMTQDPVELNQFYYNYTLSNTAKLTTRISQYDAWFSGTRVQSTETFGVLPLGINIPATGVGSVTVSGNIVNISGTGINNASINVIAFSGSQSIITSTVTVSGIYQLFLDPGDYYVMATANNYFSNNFAKTVPTGVSIYNFGSNTLVAEVGGSVVISDTFIGTDSYGNAGGGLANLRVSIFAKGQSALRVANALAVAYTNVNGTFSLSINPGRYVMLVEGTQSNNQVFQTAYDIDVDTQFANASSTNFRYLGTSQYSFLI